MTTKELIYRRPPFNQRDTENLEYSILYGESRYDKELEDILPDYVAGKEMEDYMHGKTEEEPHVPKAIINSMPPEEALDRLWELDGPDKLEDLLPFLSRCTGRTIQELRDFLFGTPEPLPENDNI